MLESNRRPYHEPTKAPQAWGADGGDEDDYSYDQWLSEVQRFRAGPGGWLLSILTILAAGPLVWLCVPDNPGPGTYSRLMAIPGRILPAVFFFVLSTIFHHVDCKFRQRRQAAVASR